MLQTPLYIHILFFIATIYTVVMFWKASGFSKPTIIIIGLWILLHALLGYSLFYTNTKGIPPRFFLSIVPALLAIVALFATKRGRMYVDKLHTPSLILMNTVRIPVEIVLFWLFVHKTIPEVMTFEGRNLDIISGLTAPLIWLITRQQKNSRLFMLWNIVCLGLLVNIVTTAALAAPFEFQQLAFDQPNIAVLYFPFILLPAVIVPLVLLSHLTMIRELVIKKKNVTSVKLSIGS